MSDFSPIEVDPYLTASFATWITGARQAYIFGKVISKMGGAEKVAAIIRFMGVSGLPVAIGVEDIIRNEKVTERAVLYFIFATFSLANLCFPLSCYIFGSNSFV